MAPLAKLEALGFTNAAIVATKRGIVTIRIRTSRGWTYERFPETDAEAEVTAWAANHSPE